MNYKAIKAIYTYQDASLLFTLFLKKNIKAMVDFSIIQRIKGARIIYLGISSLQIIGRDLLEIKN